MIGGPTASGKSKLAFEISCRVPSVIINSDSMQVYDRLSLLTNSPSEKELRINRCELFGFIKYPDTCNMGFWRSNVEKVLKKNQSTIPIFVGGTGLYLDSLIQKVSPIPTIPKKIRKKTIEMQVTKGNEFMYEKLKKIDIDSSKVISANDTQRLIRAIEVKEATGEPISSWHSKSVKKLFKHFIYIVLTDERELLYQKINKRCANLVNSGVLEEVRDFLNNKKNIEHPVHKAIGFRIIASFLKGDLTICKTIEEFSKDTRRYAKRQMTWFNNRSKHSIKLSFQEAKKYILKNTKKF